MTIGEKLTKLIDNSGKTRQEIADDLGFRSKSNVTYYEKSDKLPKTEILLKFCKYFGVSLDYFNTTNISVVHQPEKQYIAEENKIPILSDETESAKEISYMVIPHSKISDAFAIVLDDDRLKSIGIPFGSTVILTRKIKLSNKHKVVVKYKDKQFFATYEKLGENHTVIVPADENNPPIVLDDKQTEKVKIIAVVKSVICNE